MKRLITLAVMFLCCMATSFAQFSGSGSGTENDPYLILNPIQLNQMRNFLNQSGVYFKLMANIDLTEFLEDENPSQGWQPVGTSSTPFKGVLDGNGKTISGLWINREFSDYVGFFGTLNGTVKNLTLKGSKVKGRNQVGFLSGSANNCTVENCKFEGSSEGVSNIGGSIGTSNTANLSNILFAGDITGTGDCVGGLVGKAEGNGNLKGCRLDGHQVNGVNYVGGICGKANSYNISNCYVDADIIGIEYVGGIRGYVFGGGSSNSYTRSQTINCGFNGNIIGSNNVGGITGYSYGNVLIEHCYSIGNFEGQDYIGGITGYSKAYLNGGSNGESKIISTYYSGNILGNNNVGGIVGCQEGGEITTNYSSSTIIGATYVGGICGRPEGQPGYASNISIRKNIAIITKISCKDDNIGRICGSLNDKVNIGLINTTEENKAWNRTIVIRAGVAKDVEDNEQNGTGVSLTTLKLKATYVAMGWDFTNTWDIQETECYPYMKSQTAPPVIQSQVVSGATTVSGKCVDGGTITLEIDGVKQQMVSTGQEFSFTVSPLQAGHEVRVSAKADGKEQSYYATEVVSFLGKGTETDPYQISTAADLTQVYRKGYYKLMNDIDLTDYINQFSPTEGWQSIGRDGSETIHFDGDEHKVTGLWCNSTRDNTGLFSCFANGTIKNLTVKTASNKQVKGGANTGIIIGKMINGTIENCSVEGSVADGTPVGGLVGLFDGGSISKCKANVAINTTLEASYVGGLVGEITGGTIDQCFTKGSLTGAGNESYVGGLIGKNQGTLTNSYSTAVINSSYNAAGVVAYNYGLVDKCYATGNLHSNNYAAGVIGYNDGANAVVSNCAAMNNILDVVYESQQQQQGGGYGQRIIGGIKNGAPAPEMNNYALKTMQVSLNDVPQKMYDDIMNGTAKTADELRNQTTYTALGWDFTDIWNINNGYPHLTIVESADVEMFFLTYKVDGKVYRQYELAAGEPITPEAAPTKDGYTFSGWSEIPETMPANDIEVVGTFTKIPVEPSTDNTLAISDADAYVGKQIVLPIDMNNVASIQAFQFDLYLPEGVTIAKDEDEEYLLDLTGRAAKSHSMACSKQADGTLRIVCTSMSGAAFSGSEGTILNVTLDVAATMIDGDYDIEIKNIELSSGTAYNPADVKATLTVKTFTPGDTDGNGKVTVNDAVLAINHILGVDSENFVAAAADLDGNGTRTVNAVVIIINDYILSDNKQNSLDLSFMNNVTDDANYLYIEDFNIKAGETKEVEVYMNTSRTDIQGLQCDIYLPEGLEFAPEVDGEDKYYADKGGRAAKSHSVATSLQVDGSVRVVETSTSGSSFKANDQAVFVFSIKAKDDITPGTKEIKLANMELSYGGDPINPADRTSTVTVTDATGINGVVSDALSDIIDFSYDLNGKQLPAPQKGMNILKMSDGTTRKVVK